MFIVKIIKYSIFPFAGMGKFGAKVIVITAEVWDILGVAVNVQAYN